MSAFEKIATNRKDGLSTKDIMIDFMLVHPVLKGKPISEPLARQIILAVEATAASVNNAVNANPNLNGKAALILEGIKKFDAERRSEYKLKYNEFIVHFPDEQKIAIQLTEKRNEFKKMFAEFLQVLALRYAEISAMALDESPSAKQKITEILNDLAKVPRKVAEDIKDLERNEKISNRTLNKWEDKIVEARNTIENQSLTKPQMKNENPEPE